MVLHLQTLGSPRCNGCDLRREHSTLPSFIGTTFAHLQQSGIDALRRQLLVDLSSSLAFQDHRRDSQTVAAALRGSGYRVDVDDRDETVGKRIRDAELEKIPKTIVYGDRESVESLSIRDRGGEQYQKPLVDFVAELATLES